MKFVRQLNDIDCGIAVAAMAAQCSYVYAEERDPNPMVERGLTVAEMLTLLQTLTGRRWRASRKCKGELLRDADLPVRKEAVLLIRDDQKQWGHWIAWDGDLLLDPEFKRPVKLDAYDRSIWKMVRMLTPVAPKKEPLGEGAPMG
jgi:hypothetical protein